MTHNPLDTDALILALDQGTTSSRSIIFDLAGRVVAVEQQEFPQHFPRSGWVEHDARDIWDSQLATAQAATTTVGADRIAAIGITNQRETTLIWDRETGAPIGPALVWQDRRTANITDALKAAGHEAMVTQKTGLLLDPYFSATKIAWLLDHSLGARARADAGQLAFGTIDSFLIWSLTGGKVHATDATNASRTSLYNIHTGDWDGDLLDLFDVPRSLLPEVRDSAGDYGETLPALFGRPIPICGVAGDQQAAAIGQNCLTPGAVKSTYGTGCFVLMNTGTEPRTSANRLLTTVAYQIDGARHYALEGSIFIAGAAIQWLRDGLKLIETANESERMAENLDDTGGVYMVPAFTGLGAPYWDADARGIITGINRDTGQADIVRAGLEAMAYQTADLMQAFGADGQSPDLLRVDGGMVANDWLMQFMADILAIRVDRPVVQETTALGAAYLAMLGAGLMPSLDALGDRWQLDRSFTPSMTAPVRDQHLQGWVRAVRQAQTR